MKSNTLKIKLFVLALSAIFCVQTGFSCPGGNLTSVQISGGSYQLTIDTSLVGTGYTELIDVEWDFDDFSPNVLLPALSVTHNYLGNATYIITATARFKNVSNDTCTTVFTDTLNTFSYPCPVAVINQTDELEWCNTGQVEVTWDYCNYNLDNQNGSDNYWDPQGADWFVDGVFTGNSTGTDGWLYTFNSGNQVTITGNAYFLGINGETCAVEFYYILNSESIGDFCKNLLDTSNSYQNYVSFRPNVAIPNLSSESLFVCVGDTVSLIDNQYVFPVSYGSGFSHQLTLDGDTVLTDTDLPTGGGSIYQTIFNDPGQYVFELTYFYENECPRSSTIQIEVIECEDDCDSCNTFKPIPGQKYWVSAWVNENQTNPVKSFDNTSIEIEFKNGGTSLGSVSFNTTGEIIDNWQRIVGAFEIPALSTEIKIKLVNANTSIQSYFDDIRIHPFNASMKSYVYDPQTLWLTAELDDNNYATFYEYDKEGQLIRIKKETSRGIMTIQESRMANPKSE